MVRKDCQMRKKNLNPMGRHDIYTASDSECNRAIGEVLNAETTGLEGDKLVVPESVEESKKETMEVVSNVRNREIHCNKLRESIIKTHRRYS